MKPETGAGPSSDSAATQTGHSARSELRAGEVLAGRFRIESLIGIGGMGVVYRAFDLSLEIDVALKLLRPELARRPEAFRNFRQELLLARQVSSPHVVRIHDIAEDEGRWFISMDFIGGESLEHLSDRVRKLPQQQALAIARGLLEGLAAAHQRGVVHRDLKPANILLGEGDHAYITDFGIARILGSTGMTQTGVVVGTPEYLSPEQARGQRVDARSDLYALGLILYEMLAGELPFAGGTPAEAVVQRILRPPPSLARARPDLPGWLHAFSDRLLKVNPAHRFDSARAALRALDAQRVPRPPLDRRAIGACALGVLLLAGAGSWIWRNPEPLQRLFAPVPDATPRIAILPFVDADPDAQLAPVARALERHLHEWLRTDPAAASVMRRRVLDARARTTTTDLQGEALQRRLPDLANAAHANRIVSGRLSRDARGLALELSWFDPAASAQAPPLVTRGATPEALYRAYLDAAATWLRQCGLQPQAAPALAASDVARFGSALLELDRGEPAHAAEALGTPAGTAEAALLERVRLDAQEAARQVLPAEATRNRVLQATVASPGPAAQALRVQALAAGDDPDAARLALEQARRAWPNDPELALADAEARADAGDGEAALAQLRRYVREDDQDARAWFLLGRTAIVQGQAQPAVDEYLVRALVLNTRAGDAAAEAETRNALGIGYERLGQLDAAAEQYTRAAAMRERLGDKAGLGKTLRNLAVVQAQRGERDAAELTLARVRVMLEQLGDRASLADLHNDRGVIAEERGDFADALGAYREALVLRQQLEEPDLVAESLNNVAYASFQLGDFDNALVYWQQAGTLYESLDDRNGMLRIEQNIGLLDIARGHFDAAGKRLQASLQLATDRQLPEEISTAHVNLAELALAEGRHADALDHAARAREIAARRTDLRIGVEGALLQARAACALGDGAGIAAALGELPASLANREQDAMRLLVDACRAEVAGDDAGAEILLGQAGEAARESHSGKLAILIQLHEVRLALAIGDLARARRALDRVRADEARLREVPVRLEWLSLEIASALRGDDRATAARRYREALALMKGIDRYAGATILHELGARALATPAEADAARAAAQGARTRLLEDAPPAVREYLQALLEQRLQEEVTPHAS